MDPYLEMYWGDVHTSLTTYARDQLTRQVPADLRVRVEEYTAAADDHEDDTMVPLRSEPPTLRYLRITDISSGNRLVTAIEFLHRANKAGVSRSMQRGRIELYHVSLRSALPTIPVPLRQSDLPAETDIRLNLQELIDESYAAGRYDDIDYRAEPIPPLGSDDARWRRAAQRERAPIEYARGDPVFSEGGAEGAAHPAAALARPNPAGAPLCHQR